MTAYLYLHGFASSPQSHKAQALQKRFQALGLPLVIPDLNQGDFTHLTLSRQIHQASEIILSQPGPTVVIGSSLGGLTAAWLGERPELQDRIEKLVLLAPAFQFLDQWLPRLGPEQVEQWRRTGSMAVYHYTEQRHLPLRYAFVEDAETFLEAELKTEIPTLILHGHQDEVIAVTASQAYAATRPWVKLVELDSDHALVDVEAEIWQHIQQFLGF
ncbi:MAG TPA: alpha/beta fold hydrolase [Leptolyngbyaceae cyanobacterium M65_K2018_010]|nr:alpha/beta fold hydrolase [Leptolyngbyaceae cyanobacterium M65_K2018_010]